MNLDIHFFKNGVDFRKISISLIRKRVVTYERLVEEQAEKIEQARLNATEAKRLQKEVKTQKKK